MYTVQTYIDAYGEARKARIPVDGMGAVERAGYYLLASAAGTEDGNASPQKAIVRALGAGELGAAMEIFEGLLRVDDDSWMTSWPGMGSKAISGEILAR